MAIVIVYVVQFCVWSFWEQWTDSCRLFIVWLYLYCLPVAMRRARFPIWIAIGLVVNGYRLWTIYNEVFGKRSLPLETLALGGCIKIQSHFPVHWNRPWMGASRFKQIFPPIGNPGLGWVYQDSNTFSHTLETLVLGGCIKIQAHFPTYWKPLSWEGVSRFKHIFPPFGNPSLGCMYQDSITF
jgi:hypothetical protein